jgi:hypothetical protein
VRTDVLVLGVSQIKNTISIAGMTTEADPVTRLRWVRPIKRGGAVTFDDLRYDDGALLRLGDVVQMDLEPTDAQPPFVEFARAPFDEPLHFIRELTEARRAAFFPKHVDPDPRAVLIRSERSVCLVQPKEIEAIFTFDEEMQIFEARLFPKIPAGDKTLSVEDGLPVGDIYWKRWGQTQLNGEEYVEFDDATLREMLGDVYLTLALNARKRVQVIGVHTIADYTAGLDMSNF